MTAQELKWNWTKDQHTVKMGQLRLVLSDGRWTNLIFNPDSGEIERDSLAVSIDDIPELTSPIAIRMLTNQFRRYANPTAYKSAKEAGADVEPAFAWDLPDSEELNQARLRFGTKAYFRMRKWVIWVSTALIIFVAYVLMKDGVELAITSLISGTPVPTLEVVVPEG